MKRLLGILAIGLLLVSSVVAQGNGGNSAQSGNGGGGNGSWPQFVNTWLQNGGQLPQPLVVMVIREARTWGLQTCGLNQGQMLQKYAQGLLTVEFVETSPPSMTFRVAYGGNVISVILEDI